MSISSHYHKYLAKTLGETDEFVLIGENATKAGRLGGCRILEARTMSQS